MDDAIDCTCTDEVVCPYCGLRYDCSDEFFGGNSNSAEAQCDNCRKYFKMERDFSVTYSTNGMCEKNKEDHEFKEHKMPSDGSLWEICQKCGLTREKKRNQP